MTDEFQDLTAIVTGGSSGINLATARLLAARGADVAVVDLNVAELGDDLFGVNADVTDDAQIRAGSRKRCPTSAPSK